MKKVVEAVNWRKILAAILAVIMMLSISMLTGCSNPESSETSADGTEASEETTEPKDIVVLFTSDIHCGADQGWGLAGLEQVKETLEAKGHPVLLVDNGDAIQGEPLGTLTNGNGMSDLMNKAGYDVRIPGNHEFDYGMENFLKMVEESDAQFTCFNFMKDGKPVLEPYVIKDAGGKKIAFIGATTPTTITSSTPIYFQDENGNFIYDFLQEDRTGKAFYDELQKNADAARADGADYVILLGHLGMGALCKPWDYASVAENTAGIDAILDGHSHDYEQVKVSNKEGKVIPRSGCGTKMAGIGWLRIAEDGSMTTGLYNWNNDVSAPELLGIDNDMSKAVEQAVSEIDKQLDEVVGKTSVDLTIYDPEARTSDDRPIRIVRRAETNLGDFVADAFRDQTGADIAIVGGGGIRIDIPKGEVTKKDLLSVHPFSNDVCVGEYTGQQILDALEWGARAIPNETGAFCQVSGLTYEIRTGIQSSCIADKEGLFAGVNGEYRVRNVMVGDKPLDLNEKYTVASTDYFLKFEGDGMSMFGDDGTVRCVAVDNEVLMKYVEETLDGVIGEEYADPYGSGRIVAVE